MSRPYQNPFDSSQGPTLQSRNISQATSPTAAGVQPTSFKTNVNRAKTKRWVEAKSYSYDGDDWGDADDYDEYGGYDEPPQPAKPTGLRQPGQAVNPQSLTDHGGGTSSEGRQQVYQHRDYGDLTAQSTGQRQQDGTRSATNPGPSGTFGRNRVNSFDRGDEKRSFSAGPLQTDSAAEDATAYPTVPMEGHQGESYPPTQFSQTGVVGSPSGISAAGFQEQQPTRQGGHVPPSLQVQTELPTYSDRSAFDQAMPPSTNSRTPMYSEQPQQIGTGSRTQSMTSSTPSIDLQNRRDFSPSALPPPLHTRASPIPQSANDDLSATKFPPRKSSLSQRSSPYVASPVTSFHGPQVSDDSTPVSATQAEALPSLRDRAGSNATKPLPFVRPSDIYKRMEEEREKERRSQESGRPSLDSIMGRSSEDDSRSAAGLPRERTLSEAPCRGPGRKSSTESINDGDGGRRLKTILDPVQERKSEYGFEGFSADDQSSAREAPSAPSRPSADITQEQNAGPDAQSRSQSGPVLPSVHRISGFGDDFMKESTHLGDEALVNRDFPISAGTLASEADHLSPRDGGVEQPLQHHPSLGFRSVVNQAFDRPEDRSVPPTPSSIAGSGVARTNSGSTTGVSPIMSRVPSAATAEAKVRAAETREAAAPAIAEEVNETGSRPTSSGRVGTPSQASQKLPPSQSVPRVSTGSLPQPFKPGHRRDLSTPSPGNSPARSPAVEAIQVLPHAEQVEMASATPVEDELGPVDWPQAGRIKGNSRSNYATRESDTASSVNVRPEKDVSNVAIIVNEAQSSFLDSRRNNALSSSRQSRPESPIATNESPTKGKVRDLADRFETGATSRRGSTASIPSKVSLSGATVQNGGDLTPPRPLTDRSGSFRPKLPGGWESYATTSGISSPGKEFKPSIENKSKPIEHARNAPEPSKDVTTPTLAETSDQGSEDEDFDITPTTVKRTLSTSHGDSFKDPNTTRDPFSAAAAAGSALAGALAAAVGMEYHKTQSESDSSSIEGKHQTSNTDEYGAARGRSMSTESGPLHPESSKAVFPAWGTDSVSATPSASPTLPPKDTLPTEQGPVQSSDYFPLTVPLKQRIGEPERASEPFTRPQMLPSLSTEFGPQDYESDRLRKEIVRSLSPRASKHDDGSRLFLNRPETDDRGLLAEPSLMGHGRESTVLPSEYESYWNGSSDEEEPYEQSSEAQGKPQQVFEPEEKSNQLRSPAIDEQNLESISARSSDLNLTFGPHRPDLLPHRFSWEQNSVETPSPEPTPLQFAQHQENSAIPSDHSPHAGQVLAPSAIGDEPSEFVTEQDGAMELQPVPLADPAATSTKELQSDTKEGHGLFDSDPSAVHDGEVKLIPGAAGTALSTSVMSGHRSDGSLHHEYLPRYEGGLEVLKPSTEKESASSSDHQPYVISDRRPDMSESPKDQHGQSDTQYHLDPNSMGPAEAFQSTSSSPVVAQPKILAFREILALKSPTERIRAYDDTREQFANIDTGLVHWISTTISELPEHVDLISMAGRFNVGSMGHRPSPSRGKQLRSGPTSTQTMQQPYYQQYLNASALPAAPGSGSALSGTPGNGSQGFSPSGPGGAGRMTGQQVQAKGKDLLHSAGVFGGKANHAAKGLFSKGKSKFRGSGGVDKVDN
ncbi:MAG: hypothetical protein M1830_004578 [Pleopsidium flavum]|nr:MAG: hypothetical protein M1830_004578 [Pleopsidium flavum]